MVNVRLLLLGAATCALLALGWLLLWSDPRGDARPADGPSGQRAVSEASATLAVGEGANTDPTEEAERTVARDPVVASSSSRGGPARLRGRCVDRRGEPVRATLELSSPRVEVPFDRSPRSNGADGSFEIEVPAGIPFELIARTTEAAARSAPVARAEAGVTLDLGDIVFQPGRRVSGTVRDESGAACGGVLVSLHREPRGGEMRQPTRALRVVETRSDPAGGLRFPDRIEPGRWRVLGSNLVAPDKALVVDDAAIDLVIDVQVKKSDPGARITGTVLDEFGQPVPSARVRALPSQQDADGAVVVTANTASDGGFTLTRRSGAARAVRLLVDATGFETLEDARVRAWGDSGVDLRLRRYAGVAVRVGTRDGSPIEPFSLYVFPTEPTDLNELRARSSGRHAGGLAHAHGIALGDQVVLVEAAGGLVQGDLVRFRHAGGSARFDVEVARPVRRRLRCVGAEGEPVDGAAVELLLPLTQQPIAIGTSAAKLIDLWRCRGDRALRICSALSDARGEVELEGHPEARYTLRAKGAGHGTYLGEMVLGDAAPTTEVRLPQGATIAGHVSPRAFLQQLASLFSEARIELVAADQEVGTAAVASVKLGADGAFAFAHVDPGDWRLELTWRVTSQARPFVSWDDDLPLQFEPGGAVQVQSGGHPRHLPEMLRPRPPRSDRRDPATAPDWWGKQRTRRHAVATVHVDEGARLEVPVAAERLMYGTLRGRLQGRSTDPVRVVWLRPLEDDGAEARLELDRDGGFWAWLEPGTYVCEIRVGKGKRARASAAEATIVPGQATDVTFTVDVVRVELEVAGAQGGVPEGVELSVRAAGDAAGSSSALPPVDARGATVADLRPGSYVLECAGKQVMTFDVPLPPSTPRLRVVLR